MFFIKKSIKNNKWRIFLSLIYALGLIGIGLVLFGKASPWWLLAALIWSKIVQLIGHSIGMHRYFSHKSFKTSRLGEDVMAWFSVPLGIGSPIQYARNHRFHHRAVDTENDLHSPVNDGKILTAIGAWAFHDVNWFMNKGTENVRDLLVQPTFRWINKRYYWIWYSALLSTALIDWRISIYLLAMPSFIFHLELNIFVNTIGHSWGYRNFKTKDLSRNNKWVQLWTLGEGLHNNHHARPSLFDFAAKPDESDISAWVIRKFFIYERPVPTEIVRPAVFSRTENLSNASI
jgi:stearoyl-CoA desaturase (delta-9 desaturase)